MAKRSAQGQRRPRLVRHSPAVLEVFELLNLAAFWRPAGRVTARAFRPCVTA
jgi:hypothetical protein